MRIAGAWSWRILVMAGVLGLVIYTAIQFSLIVIPLMVAALLAALLIPQVAFLQRHRWPKWLAVLTTTLGLAVVVTGLVVLIVTQISSGMAELRTQTLAAYDQLKDWLQAPPFALSGEQISELIGDLIAVVQGDPTLLWSRALTLGSGVGHFLAGFLLTLFITLIFLIDGKGVWGWLVRLFPKSARPAVDGAGRAGWQTLGNFVRVQILVAAIDAIGIAVGAAILQLPLAIPIGILVFLGSFIPIVGAILTGALAVFVALIYQGWAIALIMLAIVLLVQQVEGHVLQPLIMGNAVRIHPLGVVLAVTAGALVGGIAGALFAVPIVASLNAMVLFVARGDWRQSGVPPGDPPPEAGPPLEAA